jgi:3-hydroxyisobutyrate dehydrogenase
VERNDREATSVTNAAGTDITVVGFVGLGAMGAPMARHLATQEHLEVIGYDLAPREDLGAVRLAPSLEDLAAASEVICLSLPTAQASLSVVTTICGVAATPCEVVVELSTIGVDPVRTNAASLAGRGIGLVDAPVSGGIRPAGAGTLSTMVAGASADVKRATPVLESIADKVFLMGDQPGQGQVMKLANNICALTSIVVTSEAVAYGVCQGLDMAQMIEVINASTGRTHASEFKFPRSIVPGTYDYGAAVEITSKDVHLFLEEARKADVSRTVATAADQVWQSFLTQHPKTDFTYVYEFIRSHGA